MTRQLIPLLLFLLFTTVNVFAQSPYDFSLKKELPYIGIAAGTMGVGLYFQLKKNEIDEVDVFVKNDKDINAFDRVATRFYSPSASTVSDVLWVGSHTIPFAFLGNKKTKPYFGQIMGMYGEATFFNYGFTVITKYIAQRSRPYAYNADAPDDLRLSSHAKGSFFSGHTSMTAVNTFFVAKIFSDFHPDSKWKPIVWTSAAILPALTGYLRVRAGKHFPTDVITGYAVGAAIGLLVPHLHKNKKRKDNGFRMQAGLNGFCINWQFGNQSQN